MFGRTTRSVGIWAATGLCALVVSAAPAQEKVFNRGRYDVYVAFAAHRDASIAGLGNSGWVDPNAGLYTTAWTALPPGGSVDVPKGYGSHLRVVVPVSGGHHAVAAERPMTSADFPLKIDETQGGNLYVPSGVGSGPAARQAIRNAGYAPTAFYPLAAYKRAAGSPVEVLASDASRRDLERRLGFRRLAVVGFTNESAAAVTFNFRWTPQSPWAAKTLQPNQRWLWWTGYASPRPEVEFDEGAGVAGIQRRLAAVRPFDVQLDGGTTDPAFTQASLYAFTVRGNRIRIEER